ncbi:MAG: hypothetical protein QGG64_08705, partial [Candidatus Latescibacteria bacterium]|nr:hypothetical protein [Candidatus Latescibacterota bacterium]
TCEEPCPTLQTRCFRGQLQKPTALQSYGDRREHNSRPASIPKHIAPGRFKKYAAQKSFS